MFTCTTRFGKRLEERIEPWATEDLLRLADALGEMFQDILVLAEEEGEDGTAGYVPAWSTLLNVNTCPAADLPYLGQFVGVEVPKGATEAEARADVKAESGLERGTRQSLEALLKKALGTVPFFILERTKSVEGDDAYWVTIIIPTGHVAQPQTDEEIEKTLPGGIMFTILERAGTWFVVATGKKWSEVKAGLKWSEAKEGEP